MRSAHRHGHSVNFHQQPSFYAFLCPIMCFHLLLSCPCLACTALVFKDALPASPHQHPISRFIYSKGFCKSYRIWTNIMQVIYFFQYFQPENTPHVTFGFVTRIQDFFHTRHEAPVFMRRFPFICGITSRYNCNVYSFSFSEEPKGPPHIIFVVMLFRCKYGTQIRSTVTDVSIHVFCTAVPFYS